jgi:hypothetical protein
MPPFVYQELGAESTMRGVPQREQTDFDSTSVSGATISTAPVSLHSRRPYAETITKLDPSICQFRVGKPKEPKQS